MLSPVIQTVQAILEEKTSKEMTGRFKFSYSLLSARIDPEELALL
jgi:hypothetical protein